MPFHFCSEELFAIIALIPVLKLAVPWLRSKFHRKEGCKHPEKHDETRNGSVE